jgi:vacuolar-type H+-ATPase subunit H
MCFIFRKTFIKSQTIIDRAEKWANEKIDDACEKAHDIKESTEDKYDDAKDWLEAKTDQVHYLHCDNY